MPFIPKEEFIREYTLSQSDKAVYWLNDGKVVWKRSTVKDADVESFRYYAGGWARDKNRCYRQHSPLRDADPTSFRALNFTFYTDGSSVWVLGGKIKEADASTFEVCDDGAQGLGPGVVVPYSYGKDKTRVFYYDFDGKPTWVRKASPATFESLNDGHFAKDDSFVFCGSATIPKAKVKYWSKIGEYYSKDDKRVYYFNRTVENADTASFQCLDRYWAKDTSRCYFQDKVIPGTSGTFRVIHSEFATDGKTLFGFGGVTLAPYTSDPFPLGGGYFRIGDAVFFGHVKVEDVDLETFIAIPSVDSHSIWVDGGLKGMIESWGTDGFTAYDKRRLFKGTWSKIRDV